LIWTTNTVLFNAVIIYGNALFLIPLLYNKRKYLLYGFCSFILVTTIAYARIGILSWIWRLMAVGPVKIIPHGSSTAYKEYTASLLSVIMLFIFSIAFRYIIDFFSIREQQAILQKEHMEASLNLLKAQVQPHFLFNTLNNIYYVAQKDSPDTAQMIESLSDLMRYFLESGDQQLVTLATEMKFIRQYIELEKIRMRYPLKISIHVEENTDALKIPPMLLIPLVENVFKHGIDKRNFDNFIAIDIRKTDKLFLTVKNKKSCARANGMGTGLKNLKKRLDILYALQYSFTTRVEKKFFTAELIIPV
jgi:LytS/YehU family sensor histidine kinase